MYIPRQFALSDAETEAALAQAGFAQLVTNDSSGLLITPLPLIYDGHSLVGHVSRANPHWHADGRTAPGTPGGPITTLVPTRAASSRTNSSMAEGSSSSVTCLDHGWTPHARTDSGGWTPGANSASSAAATVMISAGVR